MLFCKNTDRVAVFPTGCQETWAGNSLVRTSEEREPRCASQEGGEGQTQRRVASAAGGRWG